MTSFGFDVRDEAIRQRRITAWNLRAGPRVGDFVEMLDGTLRRLTHDWGEDIQTTSSFLPGNASFYFGDGYCSFSGSLDPAIPKALLEDTGAIKDGAVWFFHGDVWGAGRGVQCAVPCRVYRQTPQPQQRSQPCPTHLPTTPSKSSAPRATATTSTPPT